MSIFSTTKLGGKIDMARLWLVFFTEPDSPAWWARALRPGFRHCFAVSYYADQERWVEFNPSRTGTVIRLWHKDEFGPRLGQLLEGSTAVLRVASRADRCNAPPMAWCVGEVKALLGIRCAALTPWGLYHALLARGAEVVGDGAGRYSGYPQGPTIRWWQFYKV
jgi:hypothetical protein